MCMFVYVCLCVYVCRVDVKPSRSSTKLLRTMMTANCRIEAVIPYTNLTVIVIKPVCLFPQV